MLVLVIQTAEDYGSPPEIHGPFDTIEEAQEYGRDYRLLNDIPGGANVLPTEEENEAWTEAGWTFTVSPVQYEVVPDDLSG